MEPLHPFGGGDDFFGFFQLEKHVDAPAIGLFFIFVNFNAKIIFFYNNNVIDVTIIPGKFRKKSGRYQM